MITKEANVVWRGDGKSGKGEISTQSKALSNAAYGFATRFEKANGTNPEELIAAAHAACFSMALAFRLAESGFTADELRVKGAVSLDKDGQGFSIKESHLTLQAVVPGIDEKTFKELAASAKANCPVSRVLNATITLDASLVK